MTWQPERPTEPGRYWIKQYQHKRVVHLLRFGTSQMLYANENGVSRPLEEPMYDDARWWGPIHEPD